MIQMLKLLVTVTLLYISWTDWREKKIYNQHLKVLAFFVLCYVIFADKIILGDKIIGMLMISMPMVFIIIFRPGSFGGGDVKLMAICGFLLGYAGVLQAFWYAILSAAIYAVYLLSLGKGRKSQFPLGPFLCFGVLAVFFEVF